MDNKFNLDHISEIGESNVNSENNVSTELHLNLLAYPMKINVDIDDF